MTERVVQKMPLIIGMNGLAGSGKDTISDMVALSLNNHLNLTCKTFAFADNVKRAASVVFNIPLDDFYNRTVKEVKIPFWDLSPREMAQLMGTDACRYGIREDIWIKSLESNILNSGVDVVFVTDVRFDNEAEFVLNLNGVVVNIQYENAVPIEASGHVSENGINGDLINASILNKTGNPFIAAAKLQSIIIDILGKKDV